MKEHFTQMYSNVVGGPQVYQHCNCFMPPLTNKVGMIDGLKQRVMLHQK